MSALLRGIVLQWIVWNFAAVFGAMVLLQELRRFVKDPKRYFAKPSASKPRPADPYAGLKHEFIEANNLRFHVVSMGRGSGKPLMLCLHGFPESWYSWRHQIKEFSSDYEVVAFDMRGYGESEKPKGLEHYRTAAIASDVPALVHALGHNKCVLMGHDWGGAIAWEAAYRHGDVIDKLIIAAAPPPALFLKNMDADQARRSWYMLLFQVPWLPEAYLTANDGQVIKAMMMDRSQKMAVRNADAVTAADGDYYAWSFVQRDAATCSINYYRAMMHSMIWRDAVSRNKLFKKKLEMPVLVLWGKDDGALGEQLLKGVEWLGSDVRAIVIDNCSHWVQQDRVVETNRFIREFLDTAPQRTSAAADAVATADVRGGAAKE